MKPLCKIGDLAIVFRSPSNPDNVGKIVEVIGEPPEIGTVFTSTEGSSLAYIVKGNALAWLVRSQGSTLSWATVSGKSPQFYERVYADSCLMPISDPLPEDEEIANKQLEEELV